MNRAFERRQCSPRRSRCPVRGDFSVLSFALAGRDFPPLEASGVFGEEAVVATAGRSREFGWTVEVPKASVETVSNISLGETRRRENGTGFSRGLRAHLGDGERAAVQRRLASKRKIGSFASSQRKVLRWEKKIVRFS